MVPFKLKNFELFYAMHSMHTMACICIMSIRDVKRANIALNMDLDKFDYDAEC